MQDTKPVIEEDEETKAYRQQIEEQKKIREKILRQKEERRKQAAKKLQAEEEYNTVAAPIDILQKPEIKNALPITITKQEPQQSNKQIPYMRQQLNMKIVQKQNVYNSNNIQIKTTDKPDLNLDKEHINNFLNNRTIIAKDDSLIDTSIVVVNNLAAGTSEIKLRKLCQGVGDIQVRCSLSC